ncbi:MAG: hypothetical protein Q4F84_07310, partial [Fibrobacter sp.]|nr:hypothetical protein [Fibrobacter sp.]
TVNQMRMQSWLNIVYGIKGMNWYQYWGITYPENYGYMAEYYDQVTELAPAILAPQDPSISITDNANERGKRVDCFIRKYDNYYLIIAVRLTEMEYQEEPSFEPESHSVTLTLNNVPISGKKVFEYKNWTRVVDSFDIDSAKSTFTIKTKTLPVPGKVMIAGISDADTTGGYYFDDGLGNIYRNRDWKVGGRYNCGTIDYNSGTISFTAVKPYGGETANPTVLRKGKNNIRVIYTPKEQNIRFLDVKGSSFSDKFGREDVHIFIVGNPSDINLSAKFDRTKKISKKVINKYTFSDLIKNQNNIQIFDCFGRQIYKKHNTLKPVSSGMIIYKPKNSNAQKMLLLK